MKLHLTLLAALLLAPSSVLHATEFFLSPAGDDANTGTVAKPFATLERARVAVREAKKSGATDSGFTVWLGNGDYPVAKSFELTEVDSGTPAMPVVYRSVETGKARLVGARPVRTADFKPVTDAASLARVVQAARGKVLELDLNALGFKHAARYPDVFNDSGGLVELYVNGRRMPLARFPNSGYMTIKRVFANGGGQAERGRWGDQNLKQSPSGPGVFEYREEFAAEHARWQKSLDHGVWLKGYWRCPWQNEAVRVGEIDPVKRAVTLAKAVPGGIGSKYHRPEGSGEEKYWLLNLLEAVDRPGEWCVDFKDGKLYIYPPGEFASAQVAIADNAGPLVRFLGASHVMLRQLIVEQGIGHVIEIKGGVSNRVVGCTVRNVSRYGVVCDGGVGHEVLSSDLYWLGAGGVWLGGGDEKGSPRVPAGHRVINNHIHDFGLIERVYAPGVNCGFTGGGGGGHHAAVGMLVAHNLIHDTPHAGVLHGSWDCVFEFNEVLEYCRVSNDMGGFYSYDQFTRSGNQTFRYNFIHSSADGDGIYFDHDHQDMHVYGNIIALDSKGKRGTAFLYKIGSQGQGHPQRIECYNNIAINANYGFQFVTTPPSKIENNVTVNCQTPFRWRTIRDGKEVSANDSLSAGRNIAYDTDPGFVDLARKDFRLKPDARLFHDLPSFRPIPVEKIGLYRDEYRLRLPTDIEAGRVRQSGADESLDVEIEDRQN
jgi:hypothetical protein